MKTVSYQEMVSNIAKLVMVFYRRCKKQSSDVDKGCCGSFESVLRFGTDIKLIDIVTYI